MAFIIINTTNPNVEKTLRRWKNGSRRSAVQKYFIRKLGPGTYLMKANAAVLALLYYLKVKYDGVYIFVAESLEVESEFPKEVVEVVKIWKENEENLLEEDLKSLEEMLIKCYVSWNQSS